MEINVGNCYINRHLHPAIVTSINSTDKNDYPIAILLLNKSDYRRFLCSDGSYINKSVKSTNDLITQIPLYEYKNEHTINDIFHLSVYHAQRMTYMNDNGISYDNKNCVINILWSHQTKKIREKLERLQHCMRSQK